MDAPSTTNKLKWYDSNEWLLFSRLVTFDLQEGSAIAWQVVTLWVWLSSLGIPDITAKLLSASDAVISFLSKETQVCLECIKTGRIAENPLNDLPFVQLLTDNAISLQFFLTKRRQVLEGMLRVTEHICARRFVDIDWQNVANSILPAMSEIRIIATNLAAQEANTQILSKSNLEASHSSNMANDSAERFMITSFGEGSSRGTGAGERQTRHFNEDVMRVFHSTKPVQIRPFGEGGGRGTRVGERQTRHFDEAIMSSFDSTNPVQQIRPFVDNAEGFTIRPFGEDSSRMSGVRERQPRLSSEDFKRAFDYAKSEQFRTCGDRHMNQDLLQPFTESDLCALTRNLNIKDGEQRSRKFVCPNKGEEERSLFMTFSRGYAVSEREVHDFLTKSYGDCVESIYMQEVVPPRMQALFAVVVFKHASSVEIILNGREKVNFTINRKHARVRRWSPRQSTA